MNGRREAMDENIEARMNSARNREEVLEELNASTLDDVVPLGGEQVRREFSEMHELTDDLAEFVRSLAH
jgi:hypothetical protein